MDLRPFIQLIRILMVLTPHLENTNAAKFAVIYLRGQGDIGAYNFSPYEEIGALLQLFIYRNGNH